MNNQVNNFKIKNNFITYNESHFSQHPNVLANLPEALEKVIEDIKLEKDGSFIKKTVDLNKIIGKREAIELNGDEEIFYAQRLGRRILTKFVRGVQPQDCSSITFVISKVSDTKYRLITAYVGYNAEKEPLDPAIKTEEEFNRAKEYWKNTAMIEGTQAIYANTITTECPWDKFDNRMIINLANKNDTEAKIKKMQQSRNADMQKSKPKL